MTWKVVALTFATIRPQYELLSQFNPYTLHDTRNGNYSLGH